MSHPTPETNPLISAIVIFFNEEQFLAAAIASVIAQTYPHWELLLVDDGSTDSSEAIAQSFVKRHPQKIRYITHKNRANKGMSASRNLGVKAAKGSYISYLDGDDIWIPSKLAQQVSLLSAQPKAAMIYGPLKTWCSWTTRPEAKDGTYGAGPTGTHPYCDRLVPPPNLLSLFLKNEEFIPSGGIIQKAAIEAVGGYENAIREGYSDAILFVKLCLHYPVFVTADSGYWYRQHPHSSTAIAHATGAELAEEKTYLNWVQTYLTQQNIANPTVWAALNKALWPHQHPIQRQLRSLYKQAVRKAEPVALSAGRKILPASFRDWLWNKLEDYRASVYAK